MRAREEVPHGLGKVAQRLLLHGLRPGGKPAMLSACRGQLRALLVVARGLQSWPPVLLLLNSQVPHIPGMPAMLGQLHRLLSGGKQPISRHPRNLTATTDNSPKGEAAFSPPAEATGFYAATN
jgi:hypothetical protein